MSIWRETGEDCPIPGNLPVSLDVCAPCPYFRGASMVTGKKSWKINCNWPRNGSALWAPRALPMDDLSAEEIRRLAQS